jgi:hypothetical protein
MPLRFDATRSASASADNRRTASPCRKGGRWVNALAHSRREQAIFGRRRRRPRRRANSRKRLRVRSLPRPPTAARGIAGRGSERGPRNFPARNALKRRKTWKFSRRPRTGWEQPNEGAEALRSPRDLHAPAAPPSARRAPSKDGRGNFPACNPLKRHKTWKCSRRLTGWKQPTESTEGLSLAALFACARGIAIAARGVLKNGMRKFSCLQRIEKARNVKIFSAAEYGLGAIRQTAEALRSRRICIRCGAAPPSTAKQVTGI